MVISAIDPSSLRSRTVLVVEDELDLLELLADTLTEAGFHTLKARNGSEGLQRALAHHPDLIMLDVIMPVMDGIAMLERLRQDPWGKQAAVVLLTNALNSGKVAGAAKHGALDYLVKSEFDLERVVKKVKHHLAALPPLEQISQPKAQE